MRRRRPRTAATPRSGTAPTLRSGTAPIPRSGTVRTSLAALALAALVLLTGCTNLEGLQDEGRARDVDAPLVLWPGSSPAPPSRNENPAVLVPVPGVPRIPGGSMADANPLAVLDADVTAQGGTPPAPRAVRRPVLHDLTDDGKPDLLMAVDLGPRSSELRVYSVQNTVVTRVLVLRGVLAGVELAAGHLAIREPTKDPRYVSVTDYVWDGRAMDLWNLTLDDARTPQTPRAVGGSP
ncbi:hypothetical protein HXP44_25460 [Streptomyces sioyaensis]|uniref:Uncharacterized protein n=1 Tax=Streptomyces sioyaensis TaxID=67364 RepID=A0A4Q1QYT1_9ACTN|nr:hypothetical protein [Streptomyces sioyaensis]RXS65081.1 hypothetical protein EST54_19980 [Streptomyces sioyaensis]